MPVISVAMAVKHRYVLLHKDTFSSSLIPPSYYWFSFDVIMLLCDLHAWITTPYFGHT